MKRLLIIIAAALAVSFVGGAIAFGQEDEATPEDVEAAFVDLTRAEVEALGYVVDEECISAEGVGAPAALGAMGFHAINEGLIDDTIDPLEPEVVLLDPDDNVIAVEYVGTPGLGLTAFGEELVFLEPLEHDAIHLWFLDNPNGQFADFNPNASCPEPVDELPTTGTGGSPSSYGGSATLTLLSVLAAVAGASLVFGGLTLRRKDSR